MATLFHKNAQGACVDTCTLTQLLMLWEDSLPGSFPFPRAFFTLHFLLQMWWETPWLLLSFTTYLADAATDALTALLLLQAT